MAEWARLIYACQARGIQRTLTVTDALIAATAVVHGFPVVTQDGDFDRIAAVHDGLEVLRV
ncbi:MAG: PIN domain-containing protein [Dermatophilaceae bacterium]